MNTQPDPSSASTAATKHSLANDDAMRLFSQYRLFLLVAIAAAYYLSSVDTLLGQRHAQLFEVAHLGYFVAALGFIYLQRIDYPNIDTRCYIQNYLDIVFICIMMYACGGVASGFGSLLLITIAMASQLYTALYSLYFAAIASVMVLCEELFARIVISEEAANFDLTALLCSMLFLIAWLLSVPLRSVKLLRGDEVDQPTKLDLKQIATLNEEIIRELDSGVLVVDANYRVQLMNDTARTLLGCEFTNLPVHVGKLCPNLFDNIQLARKDNALNAPAFNTNSTGESLLPRYIALTSGGMLIRLDDHAAIRKQFQQLKLASLGRLSASIAHEIRNPLGAISHAVQLLQESEALKTEDTELLGIAMKNTNRIDRIVEDVLQLSNRKLVRSVSLDLSDQLALFCQRFREENDCGLGRVSFTSEPHVNALFDPEHLDQVLWNLCNNARLHNDKQPVNITISCWQASNGIAIVDVVDDGEGIPDIHREQLFEPFYSTHHGGSGLGLYIIRELCELNKAFIECVARSQGAHFRLTLSSAHRLAA